MLNLKAYIQSQHKAHRQIRASYQTLFERWQWIVWRIKRNVLIWLKLDCQHLNAPLINRPVLTIRTIPTEMSEASNQINILK